MYRVLMIEDDPMVQEINKQYIERSHKFQVTHICSTYNQALTVLETKTFDLIMVDDNLNGESGIDLIYQARKMGNVTDFIMLTANNNMNRIDLVRKLGGFDYIIKPFTYERIEKSLTKFSNQQQLLKQKIGSQADLDALYNMEKVVQSPIENLMDHDYLEKGINKATLELIVQEAQKRQSFIIDELTESLDLSHVTIRKYIRYLEKNRLVESQQEYGEIGRPFVKYHWRPQLT